MATATADNTQIIGGVDTHQDLHTAAVVSHDGTVGRRGNPYDNAMMESFMKTLKVEGVYPMAFESAEDVAEHLPRFIDSYNERRLHSALGYLSPNRFEEEQSRTPVKTAA